MHTSKILTRCSIEKDNARQKSNCWSLKHAGSISVGWEKTLFFLCLTFILKSIGISSLQSLISVFRVFALLCAETLSISAPWTGPPLSEPPGPRAKRELERPHLETESGATL